MFQSSILGGKKRKRRRGKSSHARMLQNETTRPPTSLGGREKKDSTILKACSNVKYQTCTDILDGDGKTSNRKMSNEAYPEIQSSSDIQSDPEAASKHAMKQEVELERDEVTSPPIIHTPFYSYVPMHRPSETAIPSQKTNECEFPRFTGLVKTRVRKHGHSDLRHLVSHRPSKNRQMFNKAYPEMQSSSGIQSVPEAASKNAMKQEGCEFRRFTGLVKPRARKHGDNNLRPMVWHTLFNRRLSIRMDAKT